MALTKSTSGIRGNAPTEEWALAQRQQTWLARVPGLAFGADGERCDRPARVPY